MKVNLGKKVTFGLATNPACGSLSIEGFTFPSNFVCTKTGVNELQITGF
jgi:hypothetical protein